MELRFATWNLHGGDRRQLELLDHHLANHESAIVALQEVSPGFVSELAAWNAIAWMRCSFELRSPAKYDGKNRKLATVVAAKGPLSPQAVELVPETLLPERTLAVTVASPAGVFTACSFHALAGASFKAGKVLMFRALVRWLEEQRGPVVFGMDRNAPDVDHPDEDAIEWRWKGPTREPLLFGPHAPHACRDVYRTWLAAHPAQLEGIRAARPQGPLATTFERGSAKTACRYDAIYASRSVRVLGVQHYYTEALAAGSDHARFGRGRSRAVSGGGPRVARSGRFPRCTVSEASLDSIH